MSGKYGLRVGDKVSSKFGDTPFESVIHDIQRAPCFGNAYDVLLDLPNGFGRQWWRVEWCEKVKEEEVGNQQEERS